MNKRDPNRADLPNELPQVVRVLRLPQARQQLPMVARVRMQPYDVSRLG